MGFELLQAWFLFQALIGLACYRFWGMGGLLGSICGALFYVVSKIIFGSLYQ